MRQQLREILLIMVRQESNFSMRVSRTVQQINSFLQRKSLVLSISFAIVFIGCHVGRLTRALQDRYDDALGKIGQGDLHSALSEIEQGLHDSSGSDPRWNLKFRVLKSEVVLLSGDPSNALSILPPDSTEELTKGALGIQNEIVRGRSLALLQKFPDAEKSLASADNIAVTSDNDLRTQVWLAQGDLALAEHLPFQAIPFFRKVLDVAKVRKDVKAQAVALYRLAAGLIQARQFDEAASTSAQSLEMARALGMRAIEAGDLVDLARSGLELGNIDEAASNVREAQNLPGTIYTEIDKEKVLRDLGTVFLIEHNRISAENYFRVALDLARRLKETAAIVSDLDGLAEVALEQGRIEEAGRYNGEALALNATYSPRLQPLSLFVAARIAEAQRNLREAENLLKQIIEQRDARYSWQAESELADLHAAQGETATAKYYLELAESSISRIPTNEEESRMAASLETQGFFGHYIPFLMRADDLIGALRLVESLRFREIAEVLRLTLLPPKPPSIKEVQSLLRDRDQFAIDYWLGSDKSFAWVISSNYIKAFSLPDQRIVNNAVDEYLGTLLGTHQQSLLEKQGERLYQMLFQPAETLIPRGARVVILADGSLNRLNFEALPRPGQPGHYLIEDVEIENMAGLSLLGKTNNASINKNLTSLLLLGDPIEADNTFPRLAFVPEEVTKVASHFGRDREMILSGPAATPASYAASNPGRFSLIHFAASTTLSELSPLDSAIVLSPDSEKKFKLYGRDITRIPISASVVSITGCYSAGIPSNTQGSLLGLASAFLRAGAHNVVAALWTANDKASSVLMDNFYAEMSRGKAPVSALRSAKLAMLLGLEYHSPEYWASFQIYASL